MTTLKLPRLGLTARAGGKRPVLRRVELNSAPTLQFLGEPRQAASIVLPLAPKTQGAGAPIASRVVDIATRPSLAIEESSAPPGVDLTMEAAPLAAFSGAPELAATVAVLVPLELRPPAVPT